MGHPWMRADSNGRPAQWPRHTPVHDHVLEPQGGGPGLRPAPVLGHAPPPGPAHSTAKPSSSSNPMWMETSGPGVQTPGKAK
jgi:hypothetical protein